MCKKLKGSFTVEASFICCIIICITVKLILTGLDMYDGVSINIYSSVIANRDSSRAYFYADKNFELDVEKKIWDKIYPKYETDITPYENVFSDGLFSKESKSLSMERKNGKTRVSVATEDRVKTMVTEDKNNCELIRLTRAMTILAPNDRNEVLDREEGNN